MNYRVFYLFFSLCILGISDIANSATPNPVYAKFDQIEGDIRHEDTEGWFIAEGYLMELDEIEEKKHLNINLYFNQSRRGGDSSSIPFSFIKYYLEGKIFENIFVHVYHHEGDEDYLYFGKSKIIKISNKINNMLANLFKDEVIREYGTGGYDVNVKVIEIVSEVIGEYKMTTNPETQEKSFEIYNAWDIKEDQELETFFVPVKQDTSISNYQIHRD